MAADSGSFWGQLWVPSPPKLIRLSDGGIAGMSGWKPVIERGLRWLDEVYDWSRPEDGPPLPRKPDEKNDLDVLLLRPNGEIWNFTGEFELYRSDWTFSATGSGTDFLIGAMLAGASAIEAIDLAIERMTNARPPRISMRLE